MKSLVGMAALAAGAGAALLDVVPRTEPARHHMGRTRYSVGERGRNSSRYMPHQGKREIARRQRQEARRAATAAAQ